MNKCIDEMLRNNPLWDLMKSKNCYLPFASRGMMRIPLQYENTSKQSERGIDGDR